VAAELGNQTTNPSPVEQENTHERGAQNIGTYKRRRHNNDFSHAKSFTVHIPSNQEAFHIEAPP